MVMCTRLTLTKTTATTVTITTTAKTAKTELPVYQEREAAKDW